MAKNTTKFSPDNWVVRATELKMKDNDAQKCEWMRIVDIEPAPLSGKDIVIAEAYDAETGETRTEVEEERHLAGDVDTLHKSERDTFLLFFTVPSDGAILVLELLSLEREFEARPALRILSELGRRIGRHGGENGNSDKLD